MLDQRVCQAQHAPLAGDGVATRHPLLVARRFSYIPHSSLCVALSPRGARFELRAARDMTRESTLAGAADL
jgi:hypothetical protein